jgi:aspartate ammonia-lyase
MKAKIKVTTKWRTGNPIAGDIGELKERIDEYVLESGMEIFKGTMGYEFKIDSIENGAVKIICNNNISEISETGGINLMSDQKEITLNVSEIKEVAPAVTDSSTNWEFKVEEITE